MNAANIMSCIRVLPSATSNVLKSPLNSVLLSFVFSRSSHAKVLLPRTQFPTRIAPAKRSQRDEWIALECKFNQLYKWQKNQQEVGELQQFILHDGPPYANGKPHMGHAVNKVLKDVACRYEMLSGRKVHFIPGWDCHGLPIELKALASRGKGQDLQTPLEIRKKAREYATAAIKVQKAAFQRWGIMADWDSGCYHTFEKDYVARQLRLFYRLYEEGLVFRDYKPVYWSPSTKTALAESELEYNAAHQSTSVYLKLPLQGTLPSWLPAGQVYVVIWTTTPWTLPANQAVCYSSNKEYLLVQVGEEFWIVASQLKQALEQTLSCKLNAVNQFPGSALQGLSYSHPLRKSETLPLLPANHVTVTKGTGFVHTAPAHGPEDFLVALQNRLSVKNLVNESGRYLEEAGVHLAGLDVLREGQERVLSLLGDSLVHQELLTHSYPYDWRSKKPVILRASLQWFIDTNRIKELALEAMESVSVMPANLEKPMLTQLATRPYWCISRQRSWGVPIPVFYRDSSQEAIVDSKIIERISSMIASQGSDTWWRLSADELIGKDLLKELDIVPGTVRKSRDIMDIWFDSGVSWHNVLPQGQQADLYLEGVDQFGGWFQSSLLTSVAVTGRAPYKKLFVHGFVLDSDGRKMSKSLGNVVDPQEIVDGDGKKQEAFGADVLRWWAASHVTGNGSHISVSKTLIRQAGDQVQKIRSVLRFLLGNLDGVDQDKLLRGAACSSVVDRYMLHLVSEFISNAASAYHEMNYQKVTSLSTHFINGPVSAFYCHIVKDRLYCHGADSLTRMSCVLVLNEILHSVLLVLAPLMPHLAEEVYIYHPLRKGDGGLFRRERWPSSNADRYRSGQAVAIMAPALAVRDKVNQLIGAGNTKEWSVHISASGSDFEMLQKLQVDETASDSQLCELLQVSRVTLVDDGNVDDQVSDALSGFVKHEAVIGIKLSKTTMKSCPRCRRYASNDAGVLCPLCSSLSSPDSVTC